MAEKYRMYLSERGIPLLYAGQPRDKPVVTMENYSKWYGIYAVAPDGTVNSIAWSDVDENHIFLKDVPVVMGPHLIHPMALYALADQIDAFVDDSAVEMAISRWITDSGEFDEFVKAKGFNHPLR